MGPLSDHIPRTGPEKDFVPKTSFHGYIIVATAIFLIRVLSIIVPGIKLFRLIILCLKCWVYIVYLFYKCDVIVFLSSASALHLFLLGILWI